MTIRVADYFACASARRHLRIASTYRRAANIAADAGASPQAVRAIRTIMRSHANLALAAARRTKAMHDHADSEIGAPCY